MNIEEDGQLIKNLQKIIKVQFSAAPFGLLQKM